MRKAFISPLQVFTLLIENSTHNEYLSKNGLPEHDIQPLVYSSLIQAGLDKLVFSENTKLSANMPKYVESRILREKIPSYNKAIQSASSVIDLANSSSTPNDLPLLWGFIIEMLFAMQNRSPMVTFTRLPDIKSLSQFLPLELSLPITTLLEQFTESNIGVAAPTLVSSLNDVVLCEEILAEEAYRAYVEKHEALQASDDDISILEKAITAEAKSIKNRHRILRLEKATISTIKFTSKLIDVGFAGIPGKIGNDLATVATDFFKSRERLVIYNFKDTTSKIFNAHMMHESQRKLEIAALKFNEPR